jgi:flagellar biogenesis protein FliO
MKALLRNLMVITLLLVPAYGQMVSGPAQTPAGSAGADVSATAAPTQPAQAVDMREADFHFPVFRTLGGLGMVVCLMIAAYFAAKKFAPRYFAKSTTERNLRVIETLSMGDKRSISMIEVGNSRFLIGNTPNQLNLLMALPEALSLVSEPETMPTGTKSPGGKESTTPFRNLFEVEKKRSSQYTGNPLPDDIRMKMRQLREALER